jgi:NTE family protein
MAIRASMSIPGYFTPIDYNGYYLVDGGVVNNFPVKEVREMGAEIIVAGDDQPPLRSTREEFTSLTGVLDQIITFNREEANAVARELTDLYIPLDTKYGIMDFADHDSIIAFGERKARLYFDEIKSLADSLNAIECKPLKPYLATPVEEIHVDKLTIKGYRKISRNYFKNYFDLSRDTVFTLAEIEKSIRFMYGSRFFQQVNYEMASRDKEKELIITVQEADPGYLSAGIHYDNNYGPSILLNASFRNILGKRSKLFTDMVLGGNPRFRAFYMLDNGAKPGIGAKAEFYSFRFNTYEKEEKVNEIKFTNYKASVFVNYSLKNFFNFRGGFEYEYFRFKQDVEIDTILSGYSDFSSYGNFFAMFQADTRDKHYFPTSGSKSELRVEYVMPLSKWSKDLFTSSFVAYLKYEYNHPLGRKFALRPGIFLGSTLSSKNLPPPQHWLAFGGLNPKQYMSSAIPFAGVPFVQRYGFHAIALNVKVQYNFYRKLYATLLLDAGSNQEIIQEVFRPENYIFGYGLSLGYDSFIGPVEFTLMGSNIYTKPTLFLNLGFWF